MMLALCVARMPLQIMMVSQLTGFHVETAIGGITCAVLIAVWMIHLCVIFVKTNNFSFQRVYVDELK